MAYKTLLALAAAQAVSAHFGLVSPEWRVDTLSSEEDSEYSQWTYPCAGAEFGAGNFTDWPLEGGAVELSLSHPWSYVFINLALGNGTDDFSTYLTPSLHNATSNGTLCIDTLAVPASDEIEDGTFGTLQVITTSESGNALYNCADIRFSSKAKAQTGCDGNVKLLVVDGEAGEAAEHEHDEGADEGADESTEGGSGDEEDAAGMVGVNKIALASIVGMAALVLSVGF